MGRVWEALEYQQLPTATTIVAGRSYRVKSIFCAKRPSRIHPANFYVVNICEDQMSTTKGRIAITYNVTTVAMNRSLKLLSVSYFGEIDSQTC